VLAIHRGLREYWPIRAMDRRRVDRACTEPVGAERFHNGSHTGEQMQIMHCHQKVCFITSTKEIIITNIKKLKLA
jgi:hypothetical protein